MKRLSFCGGGSAQYYFSSLPISKMAHPSPRPTFEEILNKLLEMRKKLNIVTKRVEIEPPKPVEDVSCWLMYY